MTSLAECRLGRGRPGILLLTQPGQSSRDWPGHPAQIAEFDSDALRLFDVKRPRLKCQFCQLAVLPCVDLFFAELGVVAGNSGSQTQSG